jgi:hypothetical protein
MSVLGFGFGFVDRCGVVAKWTAVDARLSYIPAYYL